MMTHMEAYVRAMMAISNISGRLHQMVEAEAHKALLASKRAPWESIETALGHFNQDMELHYLNADVDISMMLDHLLNTINPRNTEATKRKAESLLSMDEESAKHSLMGANT